MSGYLLTLATIIAINGIVACGLNVIVGFAGQISLGHAAFFGIGAYTAALLATTAGWTFWAALPCVIAMTALIGLLLGIPSLRVREDFLAITTIGINFIVEAIFNNFECFGGAMGLGGIPRVVLFDFKLRGAEFLYLCLFFLAIVVAACWWLTRCWAGLACFALREEEVAAASVGISPVRFKLLAFVIGTAMAGLGGALYAHFMRFISATDFGFPLSVSLLSMVVVGGIGTLWGPILGAVIIGVLPEVFRPLIDYRILFYTMLLLLMIRFQPGGLLGEESEARRMLMKLWPGGRS